VNEIFARPASGVVEYTILSVEINNVVALIQGNTTIYYAVDDDSIFNIFSAIYTPNKDVDGAVALFFVTIGADSKDDIITIKGAGVPIGSASDILTIHIGDPEADNSALPDFEIDTTNFGTSNTSYLGTILQVNDGAYLNIASNQTLDNALGSTYNTGTVANFKDGSVYVKDGGKVRDSAYKAWPLGDGSVFTIYSGGKLAVGPGNSDGEYVSSSDTTNAAKEWYDGWLIGDKITFGGANENINEQCIVVTQTSVALRGTATVKEDVSLMYDVWLTAGSVLTIDQGAELTFLNGTNDNNGTTKAIYGQPGTTGGLGAGEITKARPASKVIVKGKITPAGTTTILGQTTAITSGTYTCNGTTSNGAGPIASWGTYYSGWTNQ
jgi:hypothetical protein